MNEMRFRCIGMVFTALLVIGIEPNIYKLGAKVTNGSGAGFYTNNPETYFDVELEEHSWVYVKEVLIPCCSSVLDYYERLFQQQKSSS